MILVEFLEPGTVSEIIRDLGAELTTPNVWLPESANVAVIHVGAPALNREWVIVTNRKTGERVKLTL